MMMRTFVERNYTQKKKKEMTLLPKYVPLGYGDLDRELDFPSCKISCCRPPGQAHRLTPHPAACGFPLCCLVL